MKDCHHLESATKQTKTRKSIKQVWYRVKFQHMGNHEHKVVIQGHQKVKRRKSKSRKIKSNIDQMKKKKWKNEKK